MPRVAVLFFPVSASSDTEANIRPASDKPFPYLLLSLFFAMAKKRRKLMSEATAAQT